MGNFLKIIPTQDEHRGFFQNFLRFFPNLGWSSKPYQGLEPSKWNSKPFPSFQTMGWFIAFEKKKSNLCSKRRDRLCQTVKTLLAIILCLEQLKQEVACLYYITKTVLSIWLVPSTGLTKTIFVLFILLTVRPKPIVKR